MKSFASIISTGCMIMLLTSCGSGSSGSSPTPPNPSSIPAPIIKNTDTNCSATTCAETLTVTQAQFTNGMHTNLTLSPAPSSGATVTITLRGGNNGNGAGSMLVTGFSVGTLYTLTGVTIDATGNKSAVTKPQTFTPSAYDLDAALQQIANETVTSNQSLGVTAFELSVLLPNQANPQGYGIRNYAAGLQMKNGSPATTNMMVQYGSITKEFTTTLILNLINQQNPPFTLETKLGDLALLDPEFDSGKWPARWKQVTVAELLNMTSGIPENDGVALPANFNFYQVYTLDDMIDISANYEKTTPLCQQQQDTVNGCFPPGTQYFYADNNYTIAGLILQLYYDQVHGNTDTFNDIINNNILTPALGSGATLCFPSNGLALCFYTDPLPSTILANVIHGYYNGNPGLEYCPPGTDTSGMNLSPDAPAGALSGTTAGLAKLVYELFHNQFNSADQLSSTQYMVEQTNAGDPVIPVTNIQTQCSVTNCYGLGVMPVYSPALGTYWIYPGGTFGFSTVYFWIPKEGVVIVFSENTNNNQLNIGVPSQAILNAVAQYLGTPANIMRENFPPYSKSK